jgi:hypothetical protein
MLPGCTVICKTALNPLIHHRWLFLIRMIEGRMTGTIESKSEKRLGMRKAI